MSTPLFDQLAAQGETPLHAPSSTVDGLMFIGDPHLEARVPGFRRDDYPRVALEKLRWCIQFARKNRFQPVLLGDLFHYPQDNPNWLLSAIIELLDHPLPAVYGNHDVRENTLAANDSFHVLSVGGHLRLLSTDDPWVGSVGGRTTIVGGTSWGQPLPKHFDADSMDADCVVWVTHHDLLIPGFEEGRLRPKALPGIDLVVNGHIHRRLPTVTRGKTHWITPGNITRRTRSDATRARRPAVLCLSTQSVAQRHQPAASLQEPDGTGWSEHGFEFSTRGERWTAWWNQIPHRPFDEVFFPEVEADETSDAVGSSFVADLKELTARRTDRGAGLAHYLEQNLERFEKPIADEIRRLAEDVLGDRI